MVQKVSSGEGQLREGIASRGEGGCAGWLGSLERGVRPPSAGGGFTRKNCSAAGADTRAGTDPPRAALTLHAACEGPRYTPRWWLPGVSA
jgi:hypothetical protein